jgi:hypothetical protein
MEADASMTEWKSSRRFGLSLAAIAPMFQVTGRMASRFVVPISSRRPERWATAISSRTSSVTSVAIRCRSGAESAMASLVSPASLLRIVRMSSVVTDV